MAWSAIPEVNVMECISEVKSALATLHFYEGSWRKAVSLYDDAIRLWPDKASNYRLRSVAHLAAGRPRKARRDAAAAVKLDPGAAAGWLVLSHCCLVLGQLEASGEALERARLTVPQCGSNEATDLSTARRLDEEIVEAYGRGDLAGAIGCLEKVLRICWASPSYMALRSECVRRLEQHESATAGSQPALNE